MEEHQLMTIGQMAARLSGTLGGNTVEYHARQLRGWVQNGILQPITYRGEGRTAAALFDDAALLKARLCWAMVRVGLLPNQIEVATRCMNNWEKRPERIVAGCKTMVGLLFREEQWFFQISIWHDGKVSGRFTKKPDFSNPLMAGISHAHLVFDCQALWSGLIDAQDDIPTVPED